MRYSTKGVTAAVMLAGLLALGGEARGQIPLVTDVTNLSGFGAPLLAVINEVAHGNTANFELFADGQIDFTEVEALPTVGPIFNSRSCGGCHFQPALGGSGSFINEVRVRNNTAGGPVHIFANDNILRAGPQNQGGVDDLPERPGGNAARLPDHASELQEVAVPAGGGDAHHLLDDAADLRPDQLGLQQGKRTARRSASRRRSSDSDSSRRSPTRRSPRSPTASRRPSAAR